MIDYYYRGNERESSYWYHDEEQISELSNVAADLYEELQSARNRLWYQMPGKKQHFVEKMKAVRQQLLGLTLKRQCCLIRI